MIIDNIRIRIKEVNNICKLDRREKRILTKDAANETIKNLGDQLKGTVKECDCTAGEMLCVLDGIIKACLVLARTYKKEAKGLN